MTINDVPLDLDKLETPVDSDESIIYQAIAMTFLIIALGLERENLFNSSFYNNLNFQGNKELVTIVLQKTTVGNPATLQMMLYNILVMPKELLECKHSDLLKRIKSKTNNFIASNLYNVNCTYKNETNLSEINFYNHIRNAVSHSRCEYTIINGCTCVTFKDINPRDTTQHCEITISTLGMEKVIHIIIHELGDYLNKRRKKKIEEMCIKKFSRQ